MTANYTDDQLDAIALLATVRHLLTGREIDICERIMSGENSTLPEFADAELWTGEVYSDADAGGAYANETEQPLFNSLKIQFYAQITNWKNSEVAA